MSDTALLLIAALLSLSFTPAWAETADPHANHTAEPMDHKAMPEMNHDSMSGMDEGNMAGMDHSTMQDKKSDVATPRDPHAYAAGYDFNQFPMRHEGHELNLGSLRVDRLESVNTNANSSAAYELQGWYGGSFDRAVIKAEGDIDSGSVEEATTELLWSHAIATFWNSELGLRYDSGDEPDRRWLVVGIQGLAPYWFEVDATAYLGEEGRSALKLEAEYELLLTQKLILQPRLETSLYGKEDGERALGAGLSDVSLGLRLRYEIRREVAPYIGIEWVRKLGETADIARKAEKETKESRTVAGIRLWF